MIRLVITFYSFAYLTYARRLQSWLGFTRTAAETAQGSIRRYREHDISEAPANKILLGTLLVSHAMPPRRQRYRKSIVSLPRPYDSNRLGQRTVVQLPNIRRLSLEDVGKPLFENPLNDGDCVFINTNNASMIPSISSAIIFLHGKNEDGHKMKKRFGGFFSDGVRFFFPTAPVREGRQKPSWFIYQCTTPAAPAPAPTAVSDRRLMRHFRKLRRVLTLPITYPSRKLLSVLRPFRKQRRRKKRSKEEQLKIFRSFDYEHMEESISNVHTWINEQIASGVPSEKIIVGGFSQGGCIAVRAALAYPRKLGGCVLLSSFLGNNASLIIEPANRNLKVLHCHGEDDDKVPIELGQDLVSVLKERNIQAKFRSYDSLKHEIPKVDSAAAKDIKDFVQNCIPDAPLYQILEKMDDVGPGDSKRIRNAERKLATDKDMKDLVNYLSS